MDEKVACELCGNPECGCDDIFCSNCGAELKTYCTNNECDQNKADCPELPAHYCYCPICGSKTTFMEKGYIKPRTFPSGLRTRTLDSSST